MFDVSTKVDYGLIIMVDLAKQFGKSYLSLQDIAEKNNVSAKYLSQLIIPLKQAKLVQSKEGKGGGYILTKQPDRITLKEIIEAIEGPLQIVKCMHSECPAQNKCKTKPVWYKLKHEIYELLNKKTLADII